MIVTFLWKSLQAVINLIASMEKLFPVICFGFPYVRRYWGRFLLGISLSFAFAMVNGLFVAMTPVFVTRISPPEKPEVVVENHLEEPASPHFLDRWVDTQFFKAKIQEAKSMTFQWVDPWLPLKGRDSNWQQLLGGLLLLPLLAILRGALNFYSGYFTTWVGVRVIDDIRLDVFRKLQSMSLDFFNKESTVVTLARINSDAAVMHGALRLGLQDAVKAPFTILIILVALACIDLELTLLSIVFLPFLAIPIVLISKKVRDRGTKSHRNNEAMQAALLEGLTNVRITKAFDLGEKQSEEFISRIRNIRQLDMSSHKARSLLNPIIEGIAALGISAVIVYIFATGKSVAELTGFIVGIGMVYTPIKKLAGLPNYFAGLQRPINRLLELFKMEPSVKNKPRAPHLKGLSEGLEFQKVSFCYGKDKPLVVKDFSLVIPRGGRVGLAGVSGSGKSTLVNLIFRFYDPASGCVKIDGKDFCDVDLWSLREQMALVSQEVLLFNTTIAENIAMGRRQRPSEAEIIEAAKKAHADEFIRELENGYNTKIGERGNRLSGGQRQRLAIARAFVRNAPILVLDEATASLDSQAEAEVQRAIDELAENRTVVCVAHRLSTLASMDQIVVMEQGKVVEQGGFQELLQKKEGLFASMAARQGLRATTQSEPVFHV